MFTIRVNSIFHISGRGTVLAGHIESGGVWIGSRVALRTPTISVIKELRGLERNCEIVSHASTGEDVAILIQDLDPAVLIGGVELVKPENELPSWRVIDLIIEKAPKRWWEFW
jgi:translation elongation factor EF-Tu-like GTPase